MNDSSIKVLVAEDDNVNRLKLNRFLTQEMGLEVVLAEDGEQAWEIFKQGSIRFVISDWMMPGCDGIELCQRIRDYNAKHYTYFILLTGRTEHEDLIKGMSTGADDFVNKPFDPAELKLRVISGLRVIQLETELEIQNTELEAAYDALSEALSVAARTQQRMLPSRSQLDSIKANYNLNIAYELQTRQSLGGDVFGVETTKEGGVALFVADVSGHGIEASVSAVALHACIKANLGASVDKVKLIEEVNRFCCEEFPPEVYATLVFLYIMPDERSVWAVIAGHPPIIKISTDGQLEEFSSLLPPMGMFDDATSGFRAKEFQLTDGERLVAYTDGVVEAKNPKGEFFSGKAFKQAISETADIPISVTPGFIISKAKDWCNTEGPADDDITVVSLGFE